MDVILLERIEKLGQMGDVVKVKPGFARNYLLPQKKALRATKDNIAQFEGRRAQLEADNLQRREEAQKVAAKLDGLKVVIVRQAAESGHLYGSVTLRDISDEITNSGFTVERRQVLLDKPIKAVGLYPVRVALHPEVIVSISVNVARSTEEAQSQATGEAAPAEVDTAQFFDKPPAAEAEGEEAKKA